MKYRFSIFAMLEGLEQRLQRLSITLADSHHWVWEAEEGAGERALLGIQTALTTLDFLDESEHDEYAIEAVASVPDTVIEAADAVNQAKRMLKLSFQEITNERVVIDGERKPLALAILRDMGRARLNRQRAYRQLFTLDSAPSHIGYSHSQIRTVARKTNIQVLAWLSKMTQENTESYRNVVAGLDPDEHLALVKGRYGSQRANVCVEGKWSMVPAHLPLFIPSCTFNEVTVKSGHKSRGSDSDLRTRSDARLESRPLFTVGAVSVYRYAATEEK
ncbi:MAG: hypothetical protein AAF542_19385 [Pseudomonadota bacterium]